MSTRLKRRHELLRMLDREMRRMTAQSVLLSQTVANKFGIGSSDLECLDLVHLKEKVTAGELAQATGLTTGAITGVIDRLEKAGFVRRESDPRDRRKVLVVARLDQARAIRSLFEKMQQSMLALWSEYKEDELRLILDFIKRSSDVAIAETERLRGTQPAGSTRGSRARKTYVKRK